MWCSLLGSCDVLYNSTGQRRASLSYLIRPGCSDPEKCGISWPEELSQLKVRGQEQQDEC